MNRSAIAEAGALWTELVNAVGSGESFKKTPSRNFCVSEAIPSPVAQLTHALSPSLAPRAAARASREADKNMRWSFAHLRFFRTGMSGSSESESSCARGRVESGFDKSGFADALPAPYTKILRASVRARDLISVPPLAMAAHELFPPNPKLAESAILPAVFCGDTIGSGDAPDE